MNEAQWDFGRNWLHHVKKAGIDYYLAVAADVVTSEALVAAGEPCVERIDEEAAKLGGCWVGGRVGAAACGMLPPQLCCLCSASTYRGMQGSMLLAAVFAATHGMPC